MNLASPESTRIPHLPSVLRRGSRGGPMQAHANTHTHAHDVVLLDDLEDGKAHAANATPGDPDIPKLTHLDSDFTTGSTSSGPRTTSRQGLLDSSGSGNSSPIPPSPPPQEQTWWTHTRTFLLQQAKYIGPGITMSVAYCDPGNWATDLQAGSQFGYPLLFVILLTGIFGIILQVLSLRLGIVRGKDLAASTREWALTLGMSRADKAAWLKGEQLQVRSRSRSHSLWPNRARWALLSLLYFVAEGAIVCTELAELVGSAIALNLLFPALPLWAGVLITSLDVFLILFIYRPDTKSIRLFEFCVGCLVLVVISCLIALVVKVDPNWSDVFYGYVPSATVTQPGPLYVAIGILGATVMPHGLFLGSHFSIFEREGGQAVGEERDEEERGSDADDDESVRSTRATTAAQPAPVPVPVPTKRLATLREWLATHIPGVDREALGLPPRVDIPADSRSASSLPPSKTAPTTMALQSPRRMRRRILHSTIDVAISMVCFAITTNSALLIVAAQAFYFGIGSDIGSHGDLVVGDLFEAFELIKSKLNHVFAILFAVALLAAGQSASITVTLAGQIISEGMVHWRTNPFVRRCITRLITIIPSLAVAAAIGKDGLDTLLVASQVALSMALPFVLLPLLLITGSKLWMRVGGAEERGDEEREQEDQEATTTTTTTRRLASFSPRNLLKPSWWSRNYGKEDANNPRRAVFASGWILVAVTSAMYVLIVICDVFVIATTANGSGGAA